jgi:hypothetical protein
MLDSASLQKPWSRDEDEMAEEMDGHVSVELNANDVFAYVKLLPKKH